MDSALLLKLVHVFSGFWFVSGLLGRWVALSQASRAGDILVVSALVNAAGIFERAMVVPGSMIVLIAGLLTAWAQGVPILGFLQGSGPNWPLASIVLFAGMIPLIPFVFLPRGRIFDSALEDAKVRGAVTPELRAAFGDRAVLTAHAVELAGVFIILVLMFTKPF